jgi:predicted transport protein
LIDTFNLFTEQLRSTTLSHEQVLVGLRKLMIVDIALEKDHDNPQLIFESLNSTGLDLSQADLIRNYVLMGQSPKLQKEIYTNSWYPLEQSFPAEEQNRFDSFMRDYLTMKTGQIPKIDHVYESFKSLAQSSGLGAAELVTDIYKHSKNWVKLAFDRADQPELREALADLNQLKVDVAYPFLLEVMDDHDEGTIGEADLVAVVRLAESYVFRRALAGIPTNTLQKTFAALTREIDKDHYLESLKAALMLKESYGRMPSDEEVRNALLVKDVYNFRSRNYLLGKLENRDRKERIDVLGYTIEHVLPQNPDLSPEWQEELGPDWKTIQEKYLHTLGNLTLTGYNAELSDRPFQEKLTIKGGFRDSPLRLNHYLAGREHWNEKEIQTRAALLAGQVLAIWPAPELPEETLAKYRKTKAKTVTAYSLDDHPALAGPIRPLFDELRRRVQNLDAGVHEEVRKQYIAYRGANNFLEVVPLVTELKLYLDIAKEEVDDPHDLTRDVTTVGHWGTGSIEVRLKAIDQLEDVLDLIRQSFAIQGEEGYEEPQWSQAGVERVVEEASDPAVQEALLQVVEAAVRSGLYPRPWKRSLMFAPPTNRSRALFTLSVRDDDRADLYCAAEAFQTFYGLDPVEVERLLGPAGPTALQAPEIAALSERVDELMVDAEPVTNGHAPRPPWNGRDFYVTIGDRPWEDAERYGYVAAGGGEPYTKPLENLVPGARVFLYKPYPVKGFVGVGIVKEKARPVTEFDVEVDGQRVSILAAPLKDPDAVRHDADDPERREHLVRVEWLKTRPIEDAIWQSGLFTNQVTTCKLRDQETIEYLEQAFGIAPDDADEVDLSAG